MENVSVNPVFSELESEIKKTEMQLENLGAAVESFVKLNGSGDGVRKIIRKRLKKCKKFQEVCSKQ